MCGIVGYIGTSLAKPVLLEGLTRLEYRGYDSAGFALAEGNDFLVRRAVGPVQALIDVTTQVGETQRQGIAHTRWATHGAPSEINAHPHRAGLLVLVHNGIIENHAEIKASLVSRGIEFVSQTDTEVFAKLIEFEREQTTKTLKVSFESLDSAKKIQVVRDSLVKAAAQVHGHYAVLFMVQGLEGHLFGVQNGAPLVAGLPSHGAVIGSDLQALLPHTKSVSFIPVGSIFEITQGEIKYFDSKTLRTIAPKFETIEWSSEKVAKDGFEHFMLKEIYQQPLVVADTLSGRLPADVAQQGPFIWDNPSAHEALWRNVKKVYLIACGTAYHAAMTSKYYFERWARIPVEVDVASEFRYRSPILEPGTVVGVISQSGETADTLAALRLANERGLSTFSVCNVPGSTIMREAKFSYATKAGPEVGVASTKAFTAQLTVLCSLAHDVARMRGFTESQGESIARLPHDMEKVLSQAEHYLKVGASLGDKRTILFVGRGPMYPIALEGALKLKEITYRHAEGYAAGELKHGPIALVDKDLVAIVLAPSDDSLPKTLSNLEEIKSRGGKIIGIGEEGNKAFESLCDAYLPMPKVSWGIAPILYVIPLQLISYGLAKQLGCSIDKPRNLAKSVTVE